MSSNAVAIFARNRPKHLNASCVYFGWKNYQSKYRSSSVCVISIGPGSLLVVLKMSDLKCPIWSDLAWFSGETGFKWCRRGASLSIVWLLISKWRQPPIWNHGSTHEPYTSAFGCAAARRQQPPSLPPYPSFYPPPNFDFWLLIKPIEDIIPKSDAKSTILYVQSIAFTSHFFNLKTQSII